MPWYRFGSRRVQQRERAEEMRAHLEMYAEELVARGWSQDAARREARLKFGNPRVKLEEVDAMSRLANLDQILLDLRYAVRGLLASPGFTAVVLAVLALGIGTTTAIFSVVDAIVLRGLPFREAHRLVAVWSTQVSQGSRPMPLSLPDVVDYRRLQDVFEGLAATIGLAVTLHDRGQAEPLRGARVTADLFEILRVSPEVGRLFTAEHEVNGNHNVAVISHGLWHRRFGANPGIVGRRISLDRGDVEVLGVMPAGFVYPIGWSESQDIWVPFVAPDSEKPRSGRRSSYIFVVGRLKRDVTLEQANARMEQITASLASEYPAWFSDQDVNVQPLRTTIAGGDRVRSWMLMLLAAVGCVLLLTCVNVANLLLARATANAREARIRAALGASRWQLVRGALVESLLLSLTGAALGVVFAYWAVDMLRAAIPIGVPLINSVAVNLRALSVAAASALLIGVLVGGLPALQVARVNLASRLRSGERTQTAGPGSHRIRAVLVTVEVALAVVLLVGSGLFASSFIRVMSVDLGMDYRNVLTIPVSNNILDDVLERLQTVPGVTAVGAVNQNDPLGTGATRYSIRVPGREAEYRDDESVHPHWVTPGYLAAMRLPLLKGRWLEASDTKTSDPVMVLSAEAARRYFQDRDPVGVMIEMSGTKGTVVGVVGSVRLRGPETDFKPEIYLPSTRLPGVMVKLASSTLVIRTEDDPRRNNVISNVKAAIWSVSPMQAIADPKTLADRLGALVAPRRFNMVILAMFGIMGTLIATIGIYGVMAFIVTERTQEIGIRMALGAQAARVRWAILGDASRYLLIGLAIGLTTAATLAGSLETLLFQIHPRDAVVYAAASAVLVLAGLAAAFFPARRAALVDPVIALRVE